MNLDHEDTTYIVAGLRLLQHYLDGNIREGDITNSVSLILAEADMPDVEYLDTLCEKINTDEKWVPRDMIETLIKNIRNDAEVLKLQAATLASIDKVGDYLDATEDSAMESLVSQIARMTFDGEKVDSGAGGIEVKFKMKGGDAVTVLSKLIKKARIICDTPG